MDVWVATIDPETVGRTIVGVYTTEEMALAAGERVSPGSVEVTHWVLDEIVDWVQDYEYESAAELASGQDLRSA